MQKALLVITKRPEPGQTKTRLSPPLTPHQAARLYECFLRDTLALVTAVPNVTRFILYAPRNEKAYFAQLEPHFELLAQQGSNLSERLDNALTHCLRDGFRQVVIMNSDGPTLPPAYLAQAFQLLDQTEVVFGPSEDGGYYLVGLTRPQPALFRKVQMSTPTVLEDTLALARQHGLEVSLLPAWYDVDTIDDLRRLWNGLQSQPPEVAHFTRVYLNELVRQGFLAANISSY